MKRGESYRLSRVRIHDPEKLRYLGELGFYPGTCFDYLSQGPFDGPLRIRKGRDEIVLSYDLAARLFVEPDCDKRE
jgi:Fe2+ transport system protein FeoA